MSYNRRPSLRERLARFMMGRYGPDKLYYTLITTSIILVVLNLFLDFYPLIIIESILFAYALFRFMSRNVYKRSEENRKFIGFFAKIKGFFTLSKNKLRDRKTHVYKSCPACKSVLRLPRVKGPHTVRCPRCGERFEIVIK